jgi:hypothetical protein
MNKRIILTEISMNHLASEFIITSGVWYELRETLYDMIYNELTEIKEQIDEQQIKDTFY